MTKLKLTDKHFCYVIFLEMEPEDFIELLEVNDKVNSLVFLSVSENIDLYQEAKDIICEKELGEVFFDFDYDSEPFVFDKYINGKFERAYKICIFEQCEKTPKIKTSNVYCNGVPLFFDQNGNIIKISDN